MNKSIFTDNFPEIKTNNDLQKIKKEYPEYDPYYILSGCEKERKDIFDSLWQIYQPLADNNFLSDCKKHFHQRVWEMYLGVTLIKNGLDISSFKKGPDFVVNKGEKDEIFIEATACTRGNAIDAVPEEYFAEKSEKVRIQDVPYDKMLIRLTNSLDSKYKKYKNFIKKKEKPYIIAINRFALGYLDNIPLILKCLFGLGFQSFKMIDNKLFNAGWTMKKRIFKENSSEVSTLFFDQEEYDIVSAVIYSEKSILNHPKEIGSDCILVHNPKAKLQINLEIFSFLKQYKAEYNKNALSAIIRI
ncbi:MAG: hypothetical protein PHW73_02930 [Atribacterota bacterium]|nr:hypothetical protein [Atribacterota bacterium]